MSHDRLTNAIQDAALLTDTPRPLLGKLLTADRHISDAELDQALKMQATMQAPLGEILVAEKIVNPAQVNLAISKQFGLASVDLMAAEPDTRLARLVPAYICQKHSVIPWLRMGNILLVATARPDRFPDAVADLNLPGTTILPVLADLNSITTAIGNLYRTSLIERAEQRVPSDLSCRNWGASPIRNFILFATLTCIILAFAMAPALSLGAMAVFATLSVFLAMGLKTTAALAEILGSLANQQQTPTVTPLHKPTVSVMVPLLREREIAGALIRRLARLTYPKALLDIVLVLEASDTVTRATLERTKLPSWMRVIEVPEGSGLMTKPRALNYALDFCKGDIVGIWDAEDAPEPTQIDQVVNRFHACPRDVICLQGRLDYYNPRANWMARCFTIEYAAWWRLIMPGLARLGFVIPLGGTTLFFRRAELEALGGWDAHNVTEDADLGIRLARAGYRTELIETTTFEEANCRPWPWVRQRSRWLKGFAITWAVHMRNPVRLLSELGLWRFAGLQVFFVTALLPFFFAPLLWSFWLVPFGLPHPISPILSEQGIRALAWTFLGCEALNIVLNALAVQRAHHRHLIPWVPSLIAYFPLGSLAIYKALYELATKPFYWDKTQHGLSEQ